MNVCESLTVSALHFPQHTAVVFRNQSYSYHELDSLSCAAATVLENQGIQHGDRVAIQISNCPAFVIWYYAVLRLGAIAVSISTRLANEEVQYIVDDCGAKLTIQDHPQGSLPTPDQVSGEQVSGDQTSDVQTGHRKLAVTSDGFSVEGRALEVTGPQASVWFEAEPDDPALILYTSGTTGFPKGATLSHLNVRSNVAAFNHLCSMKQTDRVLLAVPLFHCFGQNALLNSVLNVGGTLVLQERFDLNETKRLIKEYTITQLYGVPLMFQLLLESCQRSELDSVTYCFSAAAPLATQTSQEWHNKFGQSIYEGYGLTETSPFASYNHRNCYTLGSIGTPIDAVEMKIVDPETGLDCAPGELGEIVIKGPNVMLGYWNRPEETEEAIRDGWFYSGDIGKKDERGFYFIVDRVKDMIAVGGLKVFPAEVERVLLQHEGISDAAVVGIEQSVLGEQVVAFVVVSEPNTTRQNVTRHNAKNHDLETIEELTAFLKPRVADYKLPRKIFFVDELPRNPSGKVLKTRLRELALEQAALPEPSSEITEQDRATMSESARESVPDSSDSNKSEPQPTQPSLGEALSKIHRSARFDFVRDYLERLVAQVKGEQELPFDEQTFMEMGLDSLMLVELGSELQLALRCEDPVPASLLFDYPTIQDLTGWVLESLESQVDPDRAERVSGTRDGNRVDQKQTEQEDQGQPPSKLTDTKSPPGSREQLAEEIDRLTEEEALEQLIRELE